MEFHGISKKIIKNKIKLVYIKGTGVAGVGYAAKKQMASYNASCRSGRKTVHYADE
jgi:hypothetical protein